MSVAQFVVIALGLVVGYWVVGKLFFPPKSAPPPVAELAWYQVLQLSPQASANEIREAYQKLIARYHPSNVEASGGRLEESAALKAVEITNAYRAGLRFHGLDA